MKAIVVTDRAAGTAGMTLTERPLPLAAINDVIVQIHASGFVATELEWPSTWTDRADRDRTPSIPGHGWPVWYRPWLRHDGAVGGTAGVRPRGLASGRHAGGVRGNRGAQPRALRSQPSTQPSDAKGRRSSAFVHKDSGTPHGIDVIVAVLVVTRLVRRRRRAAQLGLSSPREPRGLADAGFGPRLPGHRRDGKRRHGPTVLPAGGVPELPHHRRGARGDQAGEPAERHARAGCREQRADLRS